MFICDRRQGHLLIFFVYIRQFSFSSTPLNFSVHPFISAGFVISAGQCIVSQKFSTLQFLPIPVCESNNNTKPDHFRGMKLCGKASSVAAYLFVIMSLLG